MINEILAIGAWPFLGGVVIFLIVGLIATPGRIGRIACHWGLHDTYTSATPGGAELHSYSRGGCKRQGCEFYWEEWPV